MAKSIFITGTSTDIGKTYVSALIVKALKNSGKNICYYKPALSGAEIINGSIYAGDAEYVKKVSGIDEDTNNIVSFIYEYPASPHLSARLENNLFSMDKCVYDYNNLCSKYDYILAEGAGGIICPFYYENNKVVMTEDIIKRLSLPAVLVSSCGLGSINSAMLSINYIKSNGIDLKGIIFNGYKGSLIEEDNIKFIKEYSNVPVLAVVNYGDSEINIKGEVLESIFE